MSSKRRRSARPDPARLRLGSNLEVMESRLLLSGTPYLPINDYPTSPTLPTNLAADVVPIGTNATGLLPSTQNEGKVITGQDRQGNRYELRLTGPGQIIVTDTTPNDGVLDDDINTITLVGTNINQSVLTGTVQQAFRTANDASQLATIGTVYFNSLQAQQGVKTINLNGFVLTDTITPPGSAVLSPAEIALNQTTGINLHGGVQNLSIGGIDARFPASFSPVPINVVIGNPTTPLSVKPNITIDSIQNTSYVDTAYGTDGLGLNPSGTIQTGALTTPSLSLVVNGTIASFNVVSITQQTDKSRNYAPINQGLLTVPTEFIPTDSAALEYQFPTVSTTGRTAVQATAIGKINVKGAATNVTFSKSAQPFQNSLTGLNSLGSATFGSTTDAVAIDSRGNIGSLTFKKGLGNPANNTSTVNATTPVSNPINYGQPAANNGYAASGNIAVQVVTEGNIGSLTAGPANYFNLTAQDPSQIVAGLDGYTTYATIPGTAVTSSLVSAGGSIGKTKITGDLQNSEIKAGYNYIASLGGADGVSGKSSVGAVKLKGSLVNSVISASYRPNDGIYGNGNDTAGNGTITGTQTGSTYQTSTGKTVLGNQGSGVYARYTSAKGNVKKLKK